eukprot:5583461-Prorocentrum_lima.AAC.1
MGSPEILRLHAKRLFDATSSFTACMGQSLVWGFHREYSNCMPNPATFVQNWAGGCRDGA